jgi:hypothetical protein
MLSSFTTPNSVVDKLVGDGLVEDTSPLGRLVADADEECLRGGDGTAADAALEILGIFVGVSFGNPELELTLEVSGSLVSLVACATLFMVPTEGEPAIVGSWLRLRSDVSDCFCIELTV